MLAAFEIETDLVHAATGAIEVRVTVLTGEDRWCFFMTPAALAACGDWLPKSTVRFHLGVPHMIVVSEIDTDIVRRALEEIDSQGELLTHTLPYN